MRNKKRPFHFFLLAILLTICIGYFLSTYPPTYVITWKFLALPLLPLVGILFIAALFSFFTYLFHSYIQGSLIAIFITLYLFLRYINLSNFFFLFVILALFATLELFFLKKK